MQLAGKTFLITGGSSGLGAATARAFTAAEANVVIADINRDLGEQVARDLGAAARFAHCDVTSEGQAGAAVNLAVTSFGALHGAVNCAGTAIGERVVGRHGPHALDSFTRIVTLNLIGTFNITRLVAAAIVKNQSAGEGDNGVIINTASVAAFDGQIGQAAYSASKGGVAAMTLPLARELARFGIRVAAIAPGLFDTPLAAALPAPAREALTQHLLFPPRLGQPAEFAALARHIVENEMLNGEVIRLDGGIRMPPR